MTQHDASRHANTTAIPQVCNRRAISMQSTPLGPVHTTPMVACEVLVAVMHIAMVVESWQNRFEDR
jgi:hypothetical protein